MYTFLGGGGKKSEEEGERRSTEDHRGSKVCRFGVAIFPRLRVSTRAVERAAKNYSAINGPINFRSLLVSVSVIKTP